MASRFAGDAYSARFPAANYPQYVPVNRRLFLAFDGSTDETAYWEFPAPQGLTGTITVVVKGCMVTATSGTVGLQAKIEAITAGDALALSSDSFDTVNNSTSTTVPGTVMYLFEISITCTNADSIAAGDQVRISLNRDADGSAVADSVTTDFYLYSIEVRDAA